MKKKPVDNSHERVNNEDLLKEMKKLRRYIDKKFEEIKPYIDTLEDIKSAGRVFGWGMGILMSIGGAYLMLKQLGLRLF